MRTRVSMAICVLLAATPLTPAAAPPTQGFDPALWAELKWRLIGPFRGGRVLAVSGVPGDPRTFYFGAVGGGVWKSENAGRTWEALFDSQPIASIGALAVAPSDPRVLYVGSGEADMRSDISYGNGVYKSTDAGKTWRHVGLSDTRQIGRILVDPSDPNRVFVAALGHAYGPNPERGVFRSNDGGATWSRVLFRDGNTGAIDLAFDPRNSSRIFTALWQTRRPPWNVYPPSNGPGSGLYLSEDGGGTWHPVAGTGLPTEKLGRIGIAFAPSDSRRVYAIVDAREGGLYASDDGGASWRRASQDHRIWERGWYFGAVSVDPGNPDVVYVCDTALYRSTDGGKTFLPFKGAPGGDDYHQLWIDPRAPSRMILASDQGAVVTLDGGRNWSSWYNQPTAQLYHVVTDARFPYWIYGAQQDTGAVAVPSRTDYGKIMLRDWRPIAGGGESGYIAPDPSNPDVLFGGTVARFDQRTLQDQDVNPTLAYPGEYRGEWTLPLVFSPKNPAALFFGNQFVFRTVDAGRHWEKLSPDLTRENPDVPANLDPITAEDSAVKGARRGVVYAIAPSPLEEGRIWCGTDDGLVWVTRDGGKNWENVTPRELTAWSKVGILEASHFDPSTAYAAIDRHRLDDLSPHILRTRDGGKTWTEIVAGIPAGGYVNVVREDPGRRGLLYAGTETGVFVSFDDGDRWQSLQQNLPNCSIRDIAIARGDLVAATHGRSFWVLDDVSLLSQLDGKLARSDGWLFAPRETVRLHPAPFQGTPEPKDEPAGDNPPSGAILDYWLKSKAQKRLTIEIRDARGGLVRRFSSDDKPKRPDLQKIQITPDWVPVYEPPPSAAGMHRFVWNLRYDVPKELAGGSAFADTSVWAPPGNYSVRLVVDGRTWTQPLTVSRDPRIPASDADLAAQFELARRVESERLRVAGALAQAATVRSRLAEARGRASGDSAAALDAFSRKIDSVAGPAGDLKPDEFYGTVEVPEGTLKHLSISLLHFAVTVESADAAPTPDVLIGFQKRREAIERAHAVWRELLQKDVVAIDAILKSLRVAEIGLLDAPE